MNLRSSGDILRIVESQLSSLTRVTVQDPVEESAGFFFFYGHRTEVRPVVLVVVFQIAIEMRSGPTRLTVRPLSVHTAGGI